MELIYDCRTPSEQCQLKVNDAVLRPLLLSGGLKKNILEQVEFNVDYVVPYMLTIYTSPSSEQSLTGVELSALSWDESSECSPLYE